MNIVMLSGKLSSPPQIRTLASNVLLVTYELTTRMPDGSAASAPVAWFDPPKRLPQLDAGDDVTVIGQVRRRFFRTAAGITQSRTEVMADAVVPSRQTKRAHVLLTRAIADATAATNRNEDPAEAATG